MISTRDEFYATLYSLSRDTHGIDMRQRIVDLLTYINTTCGDFSNGWNSKFDSIDKFVTKEEFYTGIKNLMKNDAIPNRFAIPFIDEIKRLEDVDDPNAEKVKYGQAVTSNAVATIVGDIDSVYKFIIDADSYNNYIRVMNKGNRLVKVKGDTENGST